MPTPLLLATHTASSSVPLTSTAPGAKCAAASPARPHHVIAREGSILSGLRQGIFRSDDLGRTWSRPAPASACPTSAGCSTFIPIIPTSSWPHRAGRPLHLARWRLTGKGRAEVEALRARHRWFPPPSRPSRLRARLCFHVIVCMPRWKSAACCAPTTTVPPGLGGRQRR